jgi:hypothetical protein
VETRSVLGLPQVWPAFLVDLSAADAAETQTRDRARDLAVMPIAIFMNTFHLQDDPEEEEEEDDDEDEDDVADEDSEDGDEDDEDDPDDLDDEDGETWQVTRNGPGSAKGPLPVDFGP